MKNSDQLPLALLVTLVLLLAGIFISKPGERSDVIWTMRKDKTANSAKNKVVEQEEKIEYPFVKLDPNMKFEALGPSLEDCVMGPLPGRNIPQPTPVQDIGQNHSQLELEFETILMNMEEKFSQRSKYSKKDWRELSAEIRKEALKELKKHVDKNWPEDVRKGAYDLRKEIILEHKIF